MFTFRARVMNDSAGAKPERQLRSLILRSSILDLRLPLFVRRPDEDHAAVGSRDGAFDEQEVIVRIELDDA